MTGFRQSASGYQGVCGVEPDLTTLGKIIGGGLPVGAYGGKAEIMDMIAPAGPVYQAGTLSGNPLATTAGLAMLNLITEDLDVYKRLANKGELLANGIRSQVTKLGKKYTVNQLGSMFTLFFTEDPVNNFNDAKKADLQLFGQYFQGMLKRGIYLPPSQFESWFISDAIGDNEIAKILAASEATLTEMFS
jgi:glutamate-1-semialdehyde 2,1-aminomutase